MTPMFRQPIIPGTRMLWDEPAMAVLFFDPAGKAIRQQNEGYCDNKYLAEFLVNSQDFRQFAMMLANLHGLKAVPAPDNKTCLFEAYS